MTLAAPSPQTTPPPVRGRLHAVDPFEAFPFRPEDVDMQGWGGQHPILTDLILKTRPRLVVEVGSWKGQSAITMAKALRSLDHPAELVCVDTWLGAPEFWFDKTDATRFVSLKLKHGYPQVYYTFLNNVVSENLQDIITPFPATSMVAQKWFAAHGLVPDLIYIDAAHEYQEVIADIKGWFKLLRPGGLMIGDDFSYWWPGVIRAVEEMHDLDPTFRRYGLFDEKWVAEKAG